MSKFKRIMAMILFFALSALFVSCGGGNSNLSSGGGIVNFDSDDDTADNGTG